MPPFHRGRHLGRSVLVVDLINSAFPNGSFCFHLILNVRLHGCLPYPSILQPGPIEFTFSTLLKVPQYLSQAVSDVYLYASAAARESEQPLQHGVTRTNVSLVSLSSFTTSSFRSKTFPQQYSTVVTFSKVLCKQIIRENASMCSSIPKRVCVVTHKT